MIDLFQNYWWPWWVSATALIAVIAWFCDASAIVRGAGIALLGFAATRLSIGLAPDLHAVTAMAIWGLVAYGLIGQGLYIAAFFAALSSIAYFPVWTTFLGADVAIVAMMLALIGGTNADPNRLIARLDAMENKRWLALVGRGLVGHDSRLQGVAPRKGQEGR